MSRALAPPELKFRLDNEIAVVTAAGAGIGRSIAVHFAAAGAAVLASDLDMQSAAAVAAEITGAGGRAECLQCDVTREDQLAELVATAVTKLGGLSILVNNAGGGGPRPFAMPMQDFRTAFEINLFSAFRACQLVAPHMQIAGHGVILNVSSIAGELAASGMASYASSKAALDHLTRNIAHDLGPKGIRVNAIAPGAVRTAALASVLSPKIERMMLRRTPLGRLGEPKDIALAALFLCSPAASWISGQVLAVNGGGAQELD